MLTVLFPKTIGDAQFTACSVAEPDTAAGEVAWVSGGTYLEGDRRIRSTTHKVYECVVAVTGSAVPPEDDAINWEEVGPTNKWAWNDLYTDTVSLAASPFSVTVTPGTTTALKLRGLVGNFLQVHCKDAPGGTTYHDETYGLEEYSGPDIMWEWYFGETRQLDEFLLTGLYPHPTCEITITISATSGQVGLGRASFGNLESLGLAETNFTAKPRTFAQIKVHERFGTVTIKPGRNAVDLSGSSVVPASQANAAASTIKRLLGVPVEIIPSLLTAYNYLSTLALVEADITPMDGLQARLNIKAQGIS